MWKLNFNLEETETDRSLIAFSRRVASGWFTFLEWLTITSLLGYLNALVDKWYTLALLLLSSGIIGFYVAMLITSYFFMRSRKDTRVVKLLSWILLSFLSLIVCVFVTGILVPNLIMIYIK